MHDCDDHNAVSRVIPTQNQSSTLQNDIIREEQATPFPVDTVHQASPSHNSVPPRRSTREHKTPSYLSEFVCNNAYSQPVAQQILTLSHPYAAMHPSYVILCLTIQPT